ncbi:N-formylglutamate amidohydrolase [Roseibaca sp. Y0-43]|uniref:N-formylglutamate amidohydrolase n=1 Tax=Roseibaca sp. Y0-43 TaxID=2816854 RepID=UPI001D0CB658|nr:N-formylglutamate amidohydrolase [Roseibaca sp. Y0-43]MCC1480893.1 N-formylglutamate amidohydrolase [Roseibaca sp. Y0-43]
MQAYQFIAAAPATTAVLFASPHSARAYPPEFLQASQLDELSLRSSEDAYVDMFLRSAPAAGAHVLLGGVPRAYVDYNRASSELDPALISGIAVRAMNARISSGLGVIPRVVAGGRAIYSGKITRAQAQDRLRSYWQPYHDKLASLMADNAETFGRAILIDMHSMPRDAVTTRNATRPDVVLGDRFGASCHSDIVDAIAAIFTAAGLRVARNAPFAGAYIAQRYGLPSVGQHVVQVEIDRGLYLNEARVTPSADFDSFQTLMDSAVTAMAEIGRGAGKMVALAAE